MTKWLKPKEEMTGRRKIIEIGGGRYVFYKNSETGTGMPDAVADILLKDGEYVELKTDYHKKRSKELETGAIEKAVEKLPKSIKDKVGDALLSKEKAKSKSKK